LELVVDPIFFHICPRLAGTLLVQELDQLDTSEMNEEKSHRTYFTNVMIVTAAVTFGVEKRTIAATE